MSAADPTPAVPGRTPAPVDRRTPSTEQAAAAAHVAASARALGRCR